MVLKAKYDSQDQIPEGAQEHYVERDGAFVADIEPVDGLELSNTVKLKGALQSERAIRERIEKKVESFKGIDPDTARAAMAKLEELGDSLDTNQEEKLKALEAQLHTKYENEKAAVVEKFTEEQDALKRENSSLVEQLTQQLVRSSATSAIAAHKGEVELLLPVVERKARVRKNESGRFVAEVLDGNGNPRLSPKAASMEPMTIDELVAELRQDKTYSRAFDPIEASGSGAGGSGGISPSGAIVITKEDAHDVRKYRAARDKAAKEGRELQIAD